MAIKKTKIKATKKLKPEKKSVKVKSVPVKKSLSIKEPYKKTDIVNHISDVAELSKKQVNLVLETLQNLIAGHISKKGPKEFSLMGLFKITAIKKPATKAKKGRNPFTGEDIMIAAKPARNVIKIRPLKKLKAMAE
jgi:nucleoid DNA-binding protein